EGLIHISELGHGRVGHPSEVLEVGQVVAAQVVKLDPPSESAGSRRHVGLSLKAMVPDPWTTAATRFPVGAAVRGVVRRLEPFGAFVEIAPGIDGLVHVSKLAFDRRVSHPRQVVNLGDAVDVTVVALDLPKRRISLSMVESARQAHESALIAERAETQASLAEHNKSQKLGTLADLLAASKDKRR